MKKERKKHTHLVTLISLLFLVLIFSFSLIYINKPSLTGFTIYESASDGSTINDTYMRNDFPHNNFGTATSLRIGLTTGSTIYRSLIRDFNISSIEAGDTIVSAKLQVYVTDAYGESNLSIKAYRVTSEWIESQASWNNRTSAVLWFTLGGDYNSNEIDTVNFTNQSGTYYNISVLDTVKGWLNGSYENYGIILIAPDAEAGNYTYLASSDHATVAYRPKFIIDHQDNAVPVISNISTNSPLTAPKLVGEQINITINWSDSESDQAQLFVCNSSTINTSGCQDTAFCNTSYESSGPSSCLYTVQSSDNRTTNFWVAVCDLGNCSATNQSSFYINHVPELVILNPNGGETVNQSQGNYLIEFNSSDPDTSDQYSLTADIYYGTTQNSTENLIASDVNLTHGANCSDVDANPTTPNYCTYSWNSSGIYGTFFLTIISNDSFTTINDSSDSSFNAVSLLDSTPPNITAQWIDSDISSGESIQIYANISDPNINTVWASINTTPQTNLTMINSSDTITYNITWVAAASGNYQFKVYANDTIGNLNNSMSWSSFSIRVPNATSQNSSAPSTALPYHTIKIQSQFNATDPLRTVYAYLNVPDGFTFLEDYPQNYLMGNFSANQVKNTTWFVSVPITEATYSVNITYTDYYSNEWNSSNMQIQTTSDIGGGGDQVYSIDIAGYPEVVTQNNYYVEAYFTKNGTYADSDSITITIYDAAGSLTVGPAAMTQESTGIYNYTYSVGASATEGEWETIVNATESSISYYAHEFWKVTGGPFDVREITIENSSINALNISVITENTGGADKDLALNWNLTREDTQEVLDSGSETRNVPANSNLTWYISPSTTYIGQVRITFLGYYGPDFSEKAGAYKVFSTSLEGAYCGDGTCNNGESCATCSADCGACPSTPSGGGGAAITTKTTDFEIDVERIIYITKNIEKAISLKIKNTGETELTNIALNMENLQDSFYTISPLTIDKLSPNKEKEFQIKFFITDLTGEHDFNYVVTSNQLTKKETGKIIILSMKNYFLKEIEKLKQRIDSIKEKTDKEKLLEELKDCENIITELELNIEKEEFINAKNNVINAGDCIDKIEDKIKKEKPLLPKIKMESYWVWIITWILIILLIVILIAIAYILYKKAGVIGFLKGKYSPEQQTEQQTKPVKTLKQKTFEEKIQDIEKKLKE